MEATPWDFNSDGHADVPVGAYLEDIGTTPDAGSVTVFPGTAAGAITTGVQVLTQGFHGIPGRPESEDQYGRVMDSGDLNGDGFADLVIGVPGEQLGDGFNGDDAGVINVIYGSPSGLNLADVDRTRSEALSPFLAQYGVEVEVANFDGDGFDDLAVGVPGLDQVEILPGSAEGIPVLDPHDGDDRETLEQLTWSQASDGVPGKRGCCYDNFGYKLDAGDVNGDGLADLAIGAPGDNAGGKRDVGTVTVLYGDASTPSGLSAKGAQRWFKDSPGVRGVGHYENSEAHFNRGDHPENFGLDLGVGDVDGDGFADLVAGAPFARADNEVGERRRDAGTINVLLGSAIGVTAVGDQHLSQASPGVPGTVRANDAFGLTVAMGDVDRDGASEAAVAAVGNGGSVIVFRGVAGEVGSGADQIWTQDSPGISGARAQYDAFGSSLRFEAINDASHTDLVIGGVGEDGGAGMFLILSGTSSGLSVHGLQEFTQDTPGVPGVAEANDGFGSFF